MFVFGFCFISWSQEDKKEAITKGTPYAEIFTNFHADINPQQNSFLFDLTRANLGYKFFINENFSGNVCIDVGNPKNGSNYEFVAYLKYAAIVYDKNKWNIAGGMIGLDHFRTQEKFWGYRYIFKSFLDEYCISHSADLGVTAKYQFSKTLRFDATLRNGEGYKKQASDNTLRFGTGILFEPNKSITIRGYYDLYDKHVAQSTYSIFAGYKFSENYRLGLEYNIVTNDGWNEKNNKYGFSVYTTYQISEKVAFFGRFDQLASNILFEQTDSWNIAKDGSAIIGGIQYKPNKNIKLSLNHQGWISKVAGTQYQNLIFISAECKF